MLERNLFKTDLNKKGGLRLDYYLLENTDNSENKYGVELRQVPIDTFSTCPYLKASAADICGDYNKVCSFLEDISAGEVDPASLFDIIEDTFDENDPRNYG